jgi:hypothetical protein
MGRNQEMPNYTQALYEARELAMERMQREANEVQAEGIVGARIVEQSHGWGSHIIEFFAIGTAVVPTRADHEAEKPGIVLALSDDGKSGETTRAPVPELIAEKAQEGGGGAEGLGALGDILDAFS